MSDLISLAVFVRSAELGSLSRASTELRIAVAAASRRIKMLEAHYRVALFHRTGRGLQLTEAGTVLLHQARDLLDRAATMRRDLADLSNGRTGRVRVHSCTSGIAQYLPGDLAAFQSAMPSIWVDLSEASSTQIIRSLQDGDADLGVVVGGEDTGNLVADVYARDNLVIVAPSSFANTAPVMALADLMEEDFVLLDDGTATTRLLRSIAAVEQIALRIRAQVHSFEAICRLVQAGFGLGILPSSAAASLVQSLGLRAIALSDPWAERQLMLLTRPDQPRRSPVSLLRKHLLSAPGRG